MHICDYIFTGKLSSHTEKVVKSYSNNENEHNENVCKDSAELIQPTKSNKEE